MNKIKVSADTVLQILTGIMSDKDINYIIADPSAPQEWQGKTVQEVLNVEYYTFQHRPVNTENLIIDLLKQCQNADALYSLTRAFCILSISSKSRVFSKENDILTISANLEYWIQTEKVKLLEDLFEDISVETVGDRIPVKIGDNDRQVLIALGSLNSDELEETTEFGQMSVCNIDIDLVFYPSATTRSDYSAEFEVVDDITGEKKWVRLPFSSISISTNMTQKALPLINNPKDVGNINLARIRTFVFAFDGYENKAVELLARQSLSNDGDSSNNRPIMLKLTRGDDVYIYDCVVKDHIITIKDDLDNEMHSLTLTVRGN